MADTVTTNYGFTKPEVGASGSTWGGKLNGDLDSIDTLLKSHETSIAAKMNTADLGVTIHAATAKAAIVDADEMGLSDSAAAWVTKKLSWANVKSVLKTYFDTLYQPALGFTPANAIRTISAGGIATGGGDLSANRTITVTKSTNPQATAGVDDTTAMTPVRVKDAIAAQVAALVAAQPGVAKVAVTYNLATQAIVGNSLGVSGIVRNSTGDFTITFSTPFADTNYVIVFGAEAEPSFPSEVRAASVRNGTRATGSVRIRAGLTGANPVDLPSVSVAIFAP